MRKNKKVKSRIGIFSRQGAKARSSERAFSLNLKTSVDRWQSRSWRSQQRKIFRSEAGDRDQNMFTNELPDRFYLQLLRSTFEFVDKLMNAPQQHFGFVGLGMLRGNSDLFCTTMSSLTRHRREQKRPTRDRFQSCFGISQPHK